MKILNITAEDVMDARARIQERSYWNEQDETVEITETMEEVVAEHSLDKDEKDRIDVLMINESTMTNYVKEKMNYPLRKQDILQFPLIARELKDNDNGTVPDVKKKNISIKKQEEGISPKNIRKTSDEEEGSYMNPDSHRTAIFNKESKKVSKTVLQHSSNKNAKEAEIKSYPSLMQLQEKLELEEKRCCIPIGIKVGQKRYYDRNKKKLMSTGSSENNKEYFKSSETSSSHHKKNVRSIDINNKIINRDVDKRKFVSLMPDISDTDAQKDKFHEYSFAFRYSKYHLMKRSEEFEACSERSKELTWGSVSLGQTAHPSGYDRNNAVLTDKSSICQDVQTEPSDNSYNSLMMLRRLGRITQMQNGQPSDLSSVYDITSLETNNYSKHEKMVRLKTLRSLNDPVLLENEKNAKARKQRNFSQNRISLEDRKAIELRALKAYNKLTLVKDKKELEIRKKHDSSLINQQSMKESEASEMKFLRSYNDLTLSENRKEMETTNHEGRNLLLNCKSSEEATALRNYNELTSSEENREPEIRKGHDLSKCETSAKHEEDVETPTSISDQSSEINQEENTISSAGTRQIASIRSFDMNDRDARRVHVSLNLREITRNIEWTPHETPTSRGIVLTNKNLQCQFSEDDEFCESQQRDIVDDSIASALHEALFCKPEIARIFHATQERIGESFFPNPAFWQDSFNNDFVCQVGNETARYQNSLVDFNLERSRTAHNLGGASDNANGNRVPRQNNRDLCMIFIDREQVGNESDTAITEDSTTEIWEDACSNIADVRATSATNDNLSLQFIINVLKNFGTEVSERDTGVAPSVEEHDLEEYGDINYRIPNKDDLGISTIDDVYFNEGNNNVDKVNQSADINDTLDDLFERILDTKNNSDDEDAASSLNSLDISHKSQDEYLSTIDIHFEEKIRRNIALESADNNVTLQLPDFDNNNEFEFNALINTNEASNYFLRNPSDSSLFEAFDYYASKPNDEELQKLTLSLADQVSLKNRKKSKLKLNDAIGNAISQFQSVEILRLETRVEQDNEESNDEYEMATGFTTEQSSKTYPGEIMRQDDSYDTTYEGDSSSETPVSLEEGSLMEEFPSDAISLKTTSHTSVKISA